MGKRPAKHEGPRELEARTALAVLFQQERGKSVGIVCVEGHDLPDSDLSGAEVVRNVAVAANVPDNCIVARSLTNCTVREVAAIRDALDDLGAKHPLVITHPYHVRRTRWYLRESGLAATVVGCSATLAMQMFPSGSAALHGLIQRGEVRGLRYGREFVVEIMLTILHFLDRRGRIEMFLADRIRGSMRDETAKAIQQ